MNTYSHINPNEISEESRLRYRPEIQYKLADIELTQRLLTINRREKGADEQDKENAANEHTANCEPLQIELRDVKEKIRQLILAKKAAPPELTNRLNEILRLISEENKKLQRRVNDIDENIERLDREFNPLRMETTNKTALENVLISLASAGLRDRHACLHSRGEWASHRLKATLGLVATNRERIAEEKSHQNPSKENMEIYERRMRQHKILADDARREVDELNIELAAMREEMLSE